MSANTKYDTDVALQSDLEKNLYSSQSIKST